MNYIFNILHDNYISNKSRVRHTIHGQAGIIKTSNPGGEGREPAYDCSVLHPGICADPVQHVVEDLLTRAVMYVTFRIIKIKSKNSFPNI